MRLHALLLFAMLVGCKKQPVDDKTIESRLVGAWTWDATRDEQHVFRFEPIGSSSPDQGKFVEMHHVPPSDGMKSYWSTWRQGSWFAFDGNVETSALGGVARGNDIALEILHVDSKELRVRGPGFVCENGCILHRIDDLPDDAKRAL